MPIIHSMINLMNMIMIDWMGSLRKLKDTSYPRMRRLNVACGNCFWFFIRGVAMNVWYESGAEC